MTFLLASSTVVTAASSPSGVVHRPARAARISRRAPDSSEGVLGELDRASPAISVRTGWGMAGAPSRDCTDWLEKTRAQPNQQEKKNPNRQNQNEQCTNKRRTNDAIIPQGDAQGLSTPTLLSGGAPPFLRPAPRPDFGPSLLRDASRRA